MGKYKLEDIAPIKQGACDLTDKVWLLNLDAVESDTGRIIEYVYVSSEDIGNSTISFDTSNVLYSKLRPYLNKVVLPEKAGVATSEMLPLQPDTSVISREYLAFFLRSKSFVEYINSKTAGAKMPRANTKDLKNTEVPCPDLDTQKEIVKQLDACVSVMEMRNKQVQCLDELIKARFVEMFGDPVHNSLNLPTLPMTEVCEIIDGDRGKNYPKQDEFYDDEYCLFLNAKNVTSHGFDFKECMFITKAKDKALRKGKLKRGDVVLTTRGTLGNLAFYTETIPYENVRINSGMVILRMNRKIIDEGFFIEQFRMQVDDIKKSVASGSAQPQLPISTMNKINVIMPDLLRQKEFTAFVAHIDKSKVAVQKSLDETKVLFDSLMQEYFG